MSSNMIHILVGLVILAILVVTVFAATVLPSLAQWQSEQVARKTTLKRIDEKFKILFRISVYVVEREALVQTLWRLEVDSIFKVAQYAPPNFDYFTSGWTPVAASYTGELVHSYERFYSGDDQKMYAIVVYPDIGEWPVSAAAYLNHL